MPHLARPKVAAKPTDADEDSSAAMSQTRGTSSVRIPKKSQGKSVANPTRYDTLRELSRGIIEQDPQDPTKGGIKDRLAIVQQYGLLTSDGKPAPSVRIKFDRCLVDKDTQLEEATGCQVALVRGTNSSKDYEEKFLAHGWDGQYAGMCTIHVTAEVAEILAGKTTTEQHEWLRDPSTLANYQHYVIDGAHRVELGIANASNPVMTQGP
jgi:hypothetical protein